MLLKKKIDILGKSLLSCQELNEEIDTLSCLYGNYEATANCRLA